MDINLRVSQADSRNSPTFAVGTSNSVSFVFDLLANTPSDAGVSPK
jgi:hypothetical protein